MTTKASLDGIDVAIAAFLSARLNGKGEDVARKDAEAMLDFFGIPRKPGPLRARSSHEGVGE